MKRNFFLYYKLENKTLSEEWQDYKVKSIFETERLQDSVWREGLQDYQRGRITKVFLREGEGYLLSRDWTLTLKFEPENWTSNLNLSSVFGVYPFIDEIKHGKSSKVTWVSKVNSS